VDLNTSCIAKDELERGGWGKNKGIDQNSPKQTGDMNEDEVTVKGEAGWKGMDDSDTTQGLFPENMRSGRAGAR